MLYSYVRGWGILGQTGTAAAWPKGWKQCEKGSPYFSQIRYSIRICQHPLLTFPPLPESAQSSDMNNEMLIWCTATSNLKKKSQNSPLLQTYPSKRDISWCFCKERLRQGCFCCKKYLPVTDSCCAMPRTRLQIQITLQWNISGTSIFNVYHQLVKLKGSLAFQRR